MFKYLNEIFLRALLFTKIGCGITCNGITTVRCLKDFDIYLHFDCDCVKVTVT